MNWRRKLVDASNGMLETYWIIRNQTIYGLVEASRNERFKLSEVSGLGGEGKKRKSYGVAILEVINKHRRKYPR
jgi:hypothetical protein